jgi:hypothetical protein
MTTNTFISNLSELHLTFVLANRNWGKVGAAAQAQYNKTIASLSNKEAEVGIGRGEKMAQEFLKWCYKNKYSGSIKGIFLVSNLSEIHQVIGQRVSNTENPTKVLVQFTAGPANGFIGISTRYSASKKKDFIFNDQSLSGLDKILKLDLEKCATKLTKEAIKKLALPESVEKRKQYLKLNPGIRKQAIEVGNKILNELRDELFECYSRMKSDKLLAHIIEEWLSTDIAYPPYVNVIAKGEESPFEVTVHEPSMNLKAEAISKYGINLSLLKDDCICVEAGKTYIMSICFQYKGESLSSPIILFAE